MKINAVRVTREFKKQFQKLPLRIQILAVEKQEIFQRNPFDPRLATHELHGTDVPAWSFSVNQEYRIKFVFRPDRAALFLEIGTHGIY
jgi:mRNA-degrading endonuclease YafQ of YafQ-DinJ toxin-antitoxin module